MKTPKTALADTFAEGKPFSKKWIKETADKITRKIRSVQEREIRLLRLEAVTHHLECFDGFLPGEIEDWVCDIAEIPDETEREEELMILREAVEKL